MLTTKIYPVRDLLYARQPNESMDQLIDVITGAIEPDSWERVGGPGSINAYQGVFTISQTDRTHAKVDQLLRELRAAIQADGGPTIPFPEKPTSSTSASRAVCPGLTGPSESATSQAADESTTEESR